MALENWIDKQDGIDDILAEDINSIANAVIEAQKEINKIVIDQTYSPTSENAQSGKAVAEALEEKIDEEDANNLFAKLRQDISEKLPKNPTDWEEWTAEEQAAARERIGISGDFEMIEEIILAEDTDVIFRDTEPDGTPYNFSKVFIELPQNIENPVNEMRAYNKNNEQIFFIYRYGSSNSYLPYIYTNLISKYFCYGTFSLMAGNGSIYDSKVGFKSHLIRGGLEIASLRIYIKMRAGSVIKIYGVRV